MNKNILELRRLIYGMTNTIIVSGDSAKEDLNQLELIKSSMTIDGFIFKPDFQSSKKLKAFTDEDYMAMFAQYSITYGWSSMFGAITGEGAKDILDNYFLNTPEPAVKRPITQSNKTFNVEQTPYYRTILSAIAESKTVLREQQIRIINLMPIESS